MDISELFYNAPLDDLKKGYIYYPESESYICLICGAGFEDGCVYPADERFYEARKYAGIHIAREHGSMLEYLLGLDKRATGLTELQKQLIAAFATGQSDAETVKLTGAGSASTIRNHRFALKEKAKQARLFLAVMELMEEKLPKGEKLMPVHRTAPHVDERYVMTEDEYKALLAKYLPNGLKGPLIRLPKREKQRAALLRHIAGAFEKGRSYSEREVNELLQPFSKEEYVTLRRNLIDYGFLDRKSDGSQYWLTM